MTLQQLRYLCAIVDNGHNLTRAAASVRTSVPGVSTQISALERGLGAEILVRRRGRVMGLTELGKPIFEGAREMLRIAENLERIGADYSTRADGTMTLGMTQTHARYGLINAIARFRRAYPNVQLIIREMSPSQIYEQVLNRELDIGVTNEPPVEDSRLTYLPTKHSEHNDLSRSILVPPRHPLLRKRRITLEDLVNYPFIIMESAFTGPRQIAQAFADKGLKPKVVMKATGADVIKAYVQIGLGIAALPTVVYDRKIDRKLRAIDVTHLFGVATMMITLNRSMYLRNYMYDFIQLIAPAWTRARTDAMLNGVSIP